MLVGSLGAVVLVARFLPVTSRLGVTLVLDDRSVCAISFVSRVTTIKKNPEFLKVVLNFLFLERILCLVALRLMAENSLDIFLICQHRNCDVKISAI